MLPRRSSSLVSITPEPLFHDEEIAFTGVNVNNPLWDSGDSSHHDEDPLLPPSPLMQATRSVLPPPRKKPTKPKTTQQILMEATCALLVVLLITLIIMGVVHGATHQSTSVWASPGLMGDDDAVLLSLEVEDFDAINCPVVPTNNNNFQDYFDALQGTSNASICDEEFASECTCDSTIGPVVPQEPLAGEDLTTSEDLDVVLLGDGLIENCARGLSMEGNGERNGMAAVCHHMFRKDTSRINGLALGSSSDRAGHLLYRLQQDETILASLNPKVWWIQIGTNDLTQDHCSAESIASAIMPLVHEIKSKKPDARIVLNSIIPGTNTNDHDNTLLWERILQANEYLHCFSEDSKDFEFFNSYGLFTNEQITGSISLNGMQNWGEAIVDKVLSMVEP